MRGGGDEARAGGAGALGLGQSRAQLPRAVGDAGLERFIGARQRGDGAAFRGDIGHRDDEAAIGHLLREGIEHDIARARHVEAQRRARTGCVDPGQQRAEPLRIGPLAVQHPRDQIGKGRALPEPCARHGQKFGRTVVPAHETGLGIENAHALADVIERGAHDTSLVVHQPAMRFALGADDVGDIGLQDHGAAVSGAVFADLQPQISGQLDREAGRAVAVAAQALQGPVLRAEPVGQAQMARGADHLDVIGKGHAGDQPVADVAQLQAEAGIAQDQNIVRSEQAEAFLHRFDRIGQVAARGLGLAVGGGQAGIRLVEQIQRRFQLSGAGANLIFQHRRALELGIGRARLVGALFHAAHQHIDDLQQLVGLARRAVARVQKRARHVAARGGRARAHGWTSGG